MGDRRPPPPPPRPGLARPAGSAALPNEWPATLLPRTHDQYLMILIVVCSYARGDGGGGGWGIKRPARGRHRLPPAVPGEGGGDTTGRLDAWGPQIRGWGGGGGSLRRQERRLVTGKRLDFREVVVHIAIRASELSNVIEICYIDVAASDRRYWRWTGKIFKMPETGPHTSAKISEDSGRSVAWHLVLPMP